MVVRTVTVRLRADIADYTRGMQRASTTTARLANAGAAASTVLLAGFAVAAAAAAKFDKALSNVRAVSGASVADMKKLRKAALEAGQTTSYTATQAADAEAELARAGVSTANIIGGALKGALALAASGQVDLSEAAVVSAQAMNTFGLEGKDVAHIADLLAAGANKTAADVHGLGMSMRMGGLLAHQTGLSIEETIGTLAAFADHALIGSDAGTSLKVMLQRLVPQSNEAKNAMDAIGFSAYDANGEFVGLEELARRMKTSFSQLTPEARNSAMATIFGADAVRSATIMYELGAEGITKYVDSVNDQGAAQRMASIQLDNLVGDLHRLRGAIEVALIEGGSAANDALRGMTQFVTRVVNAYNSLPPELQHAVVGFSGIAGSIGLVVAGTLLLLPRIHATHAALVSMGVTATAVRAALMALGGATVALGVVAALAYGANKLDEAVRDAPPNVTKLGNALVDLALKGKAAGELSKTFGADLDGIGEAAARLAHPGTLDRIGDALYSISHLGMSEDAGLQEARDQIKSLDEALSSLVQNGSPDVAAKAFQRMAQEAEEHGTSTEKLRTLLPKYGEALAATDTQQKLAAESQGKLGDEAALTTDDLKAQKSAADQLSDALKLLNGVNIAAAEQEINFRQSLADLSTAVRENGRSLDVASEKGRKVKSAFLDAAKAAAEHAQAVADQQGSVEAGNAVLEKDIGLLRRQMTAAGFSKDAIDQLVGAFARLPEKKATTVEAQTGAAVADLQQVQDKIRSTKGGSFTMTALTREAEEALQGLGFRVTHMKDGRVSVQIPTGPPQAAVDTIQGAINSIRGKPVTISVLYRRTPLPNDSDANGISDYVQAPRARGGIVRRYAVGGPVQIYPEGGPVAGPGTGTSDSIPALISNGEYVVRAAAVRRYGVGMFDRLNAMRLASGGSPGYTPSALPVLGGAGDAKRRYDELVGKLREAWSDYRRAVDDLNKVRKDKESTAGERSAASSAVNNAFALVKSLDKLLGLSAGAQAPGGFRLDVYQKQLGASLAETERWRSGLAKIGQRGGEEVRSLLEDMGTDGYYLVTALADASDKMFKDIVAKLTKTGAAAKATLSDLTRQLGASTKEAQQFAADLQTLAGRGFGDLAQALAAQGDTSAMQLARQAVTGNANDVKAANAAVGAANSALAGEDLADALVLLSTLRGGPNRGFAELIGAGLSTSTIRALAPRIMGQINALPTAYRAKFLEQLVGQSGGVAMAQGGITRSPIVLAGERDAEAFIPLNSSPRSRALLTTTARLLGYDARPAGAFGGGAAGGQTVQHVTKHVEIHLHGAKQSAASQAADIARYMQFVG